MVEKISAVTLRVANMRASVMFYTGLVGLKVVYGGEDASFSSLGTRDGTDPILNLEQGKPVLQWGRLIFRGCRFSCRSGNSACKKWNLNAEKAVLADSAVRGNAVITARVYVLMHVAIFDAVNGIGPYRP